MAADLDAAAQRSVVEQVRAALPDGSGLVLLGNTAGLAHGGAHITRTKDVDVSVILLDDGHGVAPIGAVYAALEALDVEPETAPEDRSWVKAYVEVKGVPRQVDFIRGKSRDRPRGTFIDRRTLQEVVQAAQPHRDVFLPLLTDLVVMKAWAAVDQLRHLGQDPPHPSRHTERLAAYRMDTRGFTEAALDRDGLAEERIRRLLDLMADHRAPDVRSELVRAGALST